MDLYDRYGRKYVTFSEWQAFLVSSEASAPKVSTFCKTLAYSGCRISEALQLTADRVDTADGLLVIESLKKRQRGVFRAVPVPPEFLNALVCVHDLPSVRRAADGGRSVRLWNWSRATAWRRV